VVQQCRLSDAPRSGHINPLCPEPCRWPSAIRSPEPGSIGLSGIDNIADDPTTGHKAGMTVIDSDLLSSLPLTTIDQVIFFKRDELTTDLICCDVVIGDQRWTFHEELAGWDLLISHLQLLPSFREDWFSEVTQRPFTACETVAFTRHRTGS
ncbi:MAG: hypothetical protein V4579_13175, partial [Pseudomonadota bacterium]